MIEKISYDEMLNYAKELNASADVIAELIKDKEYKELENFVEEIYNYSKYLQRIVDINKTADNAIDYLKENKGTSN